MGKIYAVVRPESRDPRGRIYTLVDSLGYERAHGMLLPAGVPDDRAASWANLHKPDLLILPYHLHRDTNGETIDGVGVALLLSDHYEGSVPILMAVSEFSMEAGLDGRLHELRAKRPGIWKNVLIFGNKDIGSYRLTVRILRAAGNSASSIPASHSTQVPTVPHGLGHKRPPSGLMPRVPPLASYRTPELRINPEVSIQEVLPADAPSIESPVAEPPKHSGYFPSGKRGEGEGAPGEVVPGVLTGPGKKSGS